MQKTKSRKIWAVLAVSVMLVAFMFLATACGGSKTESVSTYQELVDALAGNCDIVKLENDIVVEDGLVVTREVVLDMNGKTLSNNEDIWHEVQPGEEGVSTLSIIAVEEGGDLTVRGNGTIRAKENDCYAFDVSGGGHLVIEDGTYVGNISVVYVLDGSAEIEGGRYSIQQLDNKKDYQFTLNLQGKCYENGTGSIVVTGGTFENFDPSKNAAESDDLSTNFVKEGYISTLTMEGDLTTYVVTEA